jgi:hypothetical protein
VSQSREAGAGPRPDVSVTVMPRAELSADGLTLVIRRRVPGGVLVTTLQRAEPFTADAIALAVRDSGRAGRRMRPGQRNRTRRWAGRYGTVWGYLMLGPPTWRRPRFEVDADGTVMAGWLRVAAAVRFEPDWEEIIFAVLGIIGDLIV